MDAENTRPQKEDGPTPLNEQRANLARHEAAFSPHVYLPNDVLRYIFVVIAQECDPVTFPFSTGILPAQLRLSHVCSRWRTLARHTFELWNNIRLATCFHDKYYAGKPLQEWALLAGNSTVSLSLDIMFDDGDGDVDALSSIIQNTVSPFKAKVLHLNMTIGGLMAVSRLPNSVLPDIRNLHLSLTDKDLRKKFIVTPSIFARLQSVTLWDQSCVANPEAYVERFPLPWSQLRCLSFSFYINYLTPIFAVLEQIPTLQSLELPIFLHRNRAIDSLEKLTMPCLRTIALAVCGEDLDKVLTHFTCPALTDLALTGSALWTDETFEIIKQQYNVQRLREIRFEGCPLPVSSILRDAPLLHTLSLKGITTMDDEAVTGISSGTLGRHLRKLCINATGLVYEITEMVEMRKRMADMLIENGCNWKETITALIEIKRCR